jgi:cell division septum initiation protein DivIVA
MERSARLPSGERSEDVEIAEREFDVAFWGCDPSEVRNFLAEVEAAQDALGEGIATLRARVVELRETQGRARGPFGGAEPEPPLIASMGQGASAALLAARADAAATIRAATLRTIDVLGDARQEAAHLAEEVRDATEVEAEELLMEARHRRKRLDEETAALLRERDELAASLQRSVEMLRAIARGLGAQPNGGRSHAGLVGVGASSSTNGRARTETEEHHGK